MKIKQPHRPTLFLLRASLLLIVALLGVSPAHADEPSAPSEPAAAVDFTESPLTLAFLGDSITHGGEYHRHLQLFFLTRYPGQGIWTFNAGYSGQTSWGVLRGGFLEKDVYPQDPDALFVHFGMNDVNRGQYKGQKNPPGDDARASRRGDYVKSMTRIVDEALNHEMQVVVLSPTIYDDDHTRHPKSGESPHLNAELKYFGDLGQNIAESKDDVSFIDLHTPMNTINQRLLAENPEQTLVGDRVHPRRGGEEVMAYTILTHLGVRPVVYDVALDAQGNSTRADGATIGEPQASGGNLSFTLTETALPFPTKRASGNFRHVLFDDDLNVMRLAVEGLEPGRYTLSIDGTEVGTFTDEEWAAGVDLAGNEETPQYQRSLELLEQTEQKKEYELAVANMRALRNNIESVKDADGNVLDWDWDAIEPEKVLDAANRELERLTAEGKKPSGWKSYVFNEGRKGFERYDEIMDGLAELRRQWQDMPATTTHTYTIQPTDEPG